MKSKFISMILFSIVFSFKISASVISIASIQIYSDENLLYEGSEIAQKIAWGNIYLSHAGPGADEISNLLDASSFCEKKGVEYLIYGFLTNEKGRNSLELKLYNHENRIIEIVFYASDSAMQTDRLITDIKSKINMYLIEKLGLYEIPDESAIPGILTIPFAAGYFFPIDTYWGEVTIPLFSIRSGIRFNPFPNIVKTENFAMNFHFGFSIRYEMALNSPDVETFYIHQINMLIPLELSLMLLNRHRFSVIVSPLYQLDILDKRRNYTDPEILLSSGFGVSTGFAYHYKFSDFFSAGVSGFLDFTFYNTPQMDFRSEISFLFHSSSIKKGSSQK